MKRDTILTIKLPVAGGRLEEYAVREPKEFMRPQRPFTRKALAAAHVVADPLSSKEPWLDAALDWDATLAYRRYLWSWGFGVADAMDTAQRGMGLDWPASLRATHGKSMDESKAARFALAHERLGSKVRRVELSVYDLSPQLGTFDVVFCGDLLLHLKDPVTACENLRAVCGGLAVIANPIVRFPLRDRRPMATFDGVDEFVYWTTNLTGLVRVVRAGGFASVEAGRPFKVPFSDGTWKGLRGVVRATP